MREQLLKLLNRFIYGTEELHTTGEGDSEIWTIISTHREKTLVTVEFQKHRIYLYNHLGDKYYFDHPETEAELGNLVTFIITTKR
ncbi:hypothetical protein VH22019_00053 [Vibrio phage VH2_2019]|nr:hypothetical protein VH22019_00053 [Vibrio phage VH2_2019]